MNRAVRWSRIQQIAEALNKPVSFFVADGGDARSKADPLLSKFISSKEGYVVASVWGEMSPLTREHMLGPDGKTAS